jgi:hypothetical protein
MREKKNNKSETQRIENSNNKLNNHNCRSERKKSALNHTLILFTSGK